MLNVETCPPVKTPSVEDFTESYKGRRTVSVGIYLEKRKETHNPTTETHVNLDH